MNSRIFLLFSLYFSQGLPFGFQTSLLPILLRTRNVSLSKVSFSRLLSLPWLLKIVFSPSVDRLSSLWSWLGCTFLAMSAIFVVPAFLGVDNTSVVVGAVLGLNAMAALQDIAVDAMAIKVLKSSELGLGNIAQVVGYKLGALAGGGVLIWLSTFITWEKLFAVIAIWYGLNGLSALQSHIKSDKQKTRSRDITESSESKDISQSNITKANVMELMKTKDFKWILLYVGVYKAGEQGMVTMMPLYLLDSSVTATDVGLITGLYTQLFSVFGSSIGGYLATRWNTSSIGLAQLLYLMCLVRVIPMGVHCVNAWYGQYNILLIITECALQLVGGAITTATFTLMMQHTMETANQAQATHFTALATVELLGKLTMMSVSGMVVEVFGYQVFFSLCESFALLVVVALR
ncbi:predicted protein, partial [Nematostella vectensis]